MSLGWERKNDRSMHNILPSSEEVKRYDNCCGIHGAARWRAGVKHGTRSKARIHDKEVILRDLEEFECEL